MRRSTQGLLVCALLAATGCGPLAYLPAQGTVPAQAAVLPAPAEGQVPLRSGPKDLADFAQALLAAGEEEWAPPAPPAAPPVAEEATPEPEELPGGLSLRFGAGLALPGGGAIGSGEGGSLPAWSDVWTAGFALEGVCEFRGQRVKPYAQIAFAQFYGQRWTNPSNGSDSWIASDGAVTALLGGAKFGIGRAFYAKAGLGVLLWPEVSRIDYYTGGEWPILDAGASVAIALGGGAEFSVGKLKAYADIEFALGTKPSDGTEDAMLFWPRFEAAGVSELKLTGGMRLSF